MFRATDYFRLKTFIEKMNDGIIVQDEQGVITLANQAYCDMFDILTPPKELIGTSCNDYIQQAKHLFKDPEQFIKRVQETLKSKEPVRDELVEMTNGRHLEIDFIPVYEGDKFSGVIWEYKDLTSHYDKQIELKALSERMRIQSLTDELTGIGNRRYLDSELAQLYSYAHRYSHPLCIAIIDIDNFKLINDTQGHEAGDYTLTNLATYLKASLRLSDLIGRMGGDELMIVMPETSLENAEKRITQIHARYQSPSSINQKVTFSVGLACSFASEDLQSTLASADQALYEAKRQGRNKVVVSVL